MPNDSADVHWDKPVWKNINDAIVMEVGKVRVAQTVTQLGRAASHGRSSLNVSAR
jgi:hypothetical protein